MYSKQYRSIFLKIGINRSEKTAHNILHNENAIKYWLLFFIYSFNLDDFYTCLLEEIKFVTKST